MLPERKPITEPITERIAGWSVRHRALAIAGWLALVVVSLLAGSMLGLAQKNSTDPGESGRADHVLDAQSGYLPLQENVLVQSTSSAARLPGDSALRATVEDLTGKLRDRGVGTVRSPLDRNGAGLVSPDGRSGLVTIQIAGPYEELPHRYDMIKRSLAEVTTGHPGVRLAQAGDKSLSDAVNLGIKGDMKKAEFLSLPITMIILLVVFGSLLTAGIPLLLAVTTVAAAFGLLHVAGHWIPINSATSSIVLLIGLAVGIDYSLFYLRRAREERAFGRAVDEALRITARTSGHVVIVSGLTVMLCLTGLLLTGLDNFKGLTAGIVTVVSLAMLGSVTALPAMLALLGQRVDRTRVHGLGRRRTVTGQSRLWTSLAHQVVRRPLMWGGPATLALLVLSAPMLGLRLQDAAVTDSLPRTVPVVDAALRMQRAFPGSPSPAWVVLWEKRRGALDAPAVTTAVARLRPLSTARADRVLVARVPLSDFGTGDRAMLSLQRLRRDAAALDRLDGVEHAVAGKTAFAYDFTHVIKERSPLVVGSVLSLAFVLLAVWFRSVAVALVSILLNLLSLGAACGVLTWIFQEGNFGGLLGFTPYGGVVGWLPLFMFTILFGLSMDYHLFILSRIRERRAAGASTADAIVGGIGTSAGVVTSAAAIMVAAFSVFVVLSAIEYKMMGVGLAVAVLLDATLVRGVLLPAAMAVLGERVWRRPTATTQAPPPAAASVAARS